MSYKGKLLFGALAVVLVVLSFLGGVSVSPERRVTVTSTLVVTTTVTPGPPVVTGKGQRVKINQTFTVLCGLSGETKVPVQVTFLRASYTQEMAPYRAEKGYKLLVVDVSIKNVGFKETSVFEFAPIRGWTVKVDKGYLYDSEILAFLPGSVRPEEIKTGYAVFEILADTRAVEVYGRIFYADVDFILEL